MTQIHRLLGKASLPAVFAILVILLLPGAARAQELYTFTAGLLGGVGGSLDAEPGDDLGNNGYQINLTMVTEPRTHVGFRLGRLGLDGDEFFGPLSDAELSYITLAGEYRLPESFYDSGIFIGLGGYRLEGNRGGRDEEETSFGLTVGVSGEFRINQWLGVLLELSGHYADFEDAQLFAMGHGGIAVHF